METQQTINKDKYEEIIYGINKELKTQYPNKRKRKALKKSQNKGNY